MSPSSRFSRVDGGLIAALCASATLACGAEAPADDAVVAEPRPLPALCARDRADAVRDVFCGDEAPDIESITDLESRLELLPASSTTDTPNGYYGGAVDFLGGRGVVLLGHSTALSGDLVSPINPRLIVLGRNAILAFNRGTQQVELISRDRTQPVLNFYLLDFEQECNAAPGGCTPGDLYTPRVEAGWTKVAIRDDEDLKNTAFDCRQCHQRGTQGPLLLMRELDGPWTHFFLSDQGEAGKLPEPTGVDLAKDYRTAKGDEAYGGVPPALLRTTAGLLLQNSVSATQPLVFDGVRIMNERWPFGPDGFAEAPARSETWDASYAAFKRGEVLALPHYDPRPTDGDKQAALSDAYRRYRDGELPAEELPDLGDIFPDDPVLRAEIGLQTEPSATPAEALVQACGTCHNDVLDQDISRARFNIDLARMDRAELDLAVERLLLPPDALGAMPPPGRRQLHEGGREALVEYLRQDVRSQEDDAFLARAAELGMAGTFPH